MSITVFTKPEFHLLSWYRKFVTDTTIKKNDYRLYLYPSLPLSVIMGNRKKIQYKIKSHRFFKGSTNSPCFPTQFLSGLTVALPMLPSHNLTSHKWIPSIRNSLPAQHSFMLETISMNIPPFSMPPSLTMYVDPLFLSPS